MWYCQDCTARNFESGQEMIENGHFGKMDTIQVTKIYDQSICKSIHCGRCDRIQTVKYENIKPAKTLI